MITNPVNMIVWPTMARTATTATVGSSPSPSRPPTTISPTSVALLRSLRKLTISRGSTSTIAPSQMTVLGPPVQYGSRAIHGTLRTSCATADATASTAAASTPLSAIWSTQRRSSLPPAGLPRAARCRRSLIHRLYSST